MKPAIAIQYFLIDRFFVESAFGFFRKAVSHRYIMNKKNVKID